MCCKIIGNVSCSVPPALAVCRGQVVGGVGALGVKLSGSPARLQGPNLPHSLPGKVGCQLG